MKHTTELILSIRLSRTTARIPCIPVYWVYRECGWAASQQLAMMMA